MDSQRDKPGPAAGTNLDQLIDRFEEAWQRDTPPRLEDFLPPAACARPDSEDLFASLKELIKIDLEYRWQRQLPLAGSGSERPRLEPYLERYPQLRRAEPLVLELLGEEYRIRHCWGDRPGPAEYVQRFPGYAARLEATLRRVDAELAAEIAREGGPATSVTPVRPADPAAPALSAAALIDSLGKQQLLDAGQLKELTRDLHAGAGDAPPLARELLRRQWLTAYQVNQLLLGRGQDLVVGPYLLLERLGEGGTGQVFKARHRQMARTVALKIIRRDLLGDPEVVTRFYREIHMVGRLSHPNIIHAYDAGPIGTLHVLVMEYVEGTDLARLVKQGGPLPVAQACEYIRQVAGGLAYAHARGLVHRDIKPPNLLVTRGQGTQPAGVVKILDLGLARLQRPPDGEATSMTTPTGAMVMGTPDYLAPEQALDFHHADIRADIYGLGCTLFYVLTGQPPFPGGMLAQKLLRHQHSAPPALRTLRPEAPAALAAVVERMLAKRPEVRYQTPAEVAAALAPFCQGGARTAGWAVLPPARSRRQLLIAAGTLCALVGSLSFLLLRPTARTGTSPESRSWLDRLDPGQIPVDKRDGLPPGTVAVLDCGSEARWMSFVADGRLMAITRGEDRNGGLRIHELSANRVQNVFRLEAEGNFTAVKVSPDGTLLGTGQSSGIVKVWDLREREPKLRHTLPGHTGNINHIAFAAQTGRLASAAWVKKENQDYSEVKLWNLTPRPPAVETKPVSGMVGSMAFSADGSVLAIAQSAGAIRLWNAATGQELPDLKIHEPMGSLAFAPGGKTLAGAGAHRRDLQVFDVSDRKMLWSRPTSGEPSQAGAYVAYAADGKTLLAQNLTDDVVLWDVATAQSLKTVTVPAARRIAWSPDGRYLAAATGNGSVYIIRFP
jgi:serine/threonine protein kinase